MSSRYNQYMDEVKELAKEYPIPWFVLHKVLSGRILSCNIVPDVCRSCHRFYKKGCPYPWWLKKEYDQKLVKEFKGKVRQLCKRSK